MPRSRGESPLDFTLLPYPERKRRFPLMTGTVFHRVEDLLAGAGAEYRVLRHAEVFTSAEAAAVRGTPLSSGAKALVMKADETLLMFVLPADRKLNSKQVRESLACRSLRFADKDEVDRITGLPPGAIPPFGSLFGLPTHCDERLGEHEWINFNAGDRAISVSLRYADYLRLEQPRLGTFAQ